MLVDEGIVHLVNHPIRERGAGGQCPWHPTQKKERSEHLVHPLFVPIMQWVYLGVFRVCIGCFRGVLGVYMVYIHV